jgi:hypothetical protein
MCVLWCSFDKNVIYRALAQNCYAKVDAEEGADAGDDWQKGLPIRVVRGYKLAKLSQYAPSVGYRYISNVNYTYSAMLSPEY